MTISLAAPSPDIPIAPLETIDFVRLESKDPAEVAKLLHACQTQGFFYLALEGTAESARVVADKNDVLRVMETYFAQPLEVKMQDNQGSVTDGYKPVGIFTGAAQETRDGYETLKVSRNSLRENSPYIAKIIQENAGLFSSFIERSHHVTTTLLSRLSDALGLENAARFEQSHREGEPTNTTLVLLKYPKDVCTDNLGHNKHTDIGSITFLFSSQWGLQVVTPGTKAWAYVQPRPNHAIINVGDSLRFLSGKKLASCLHRVVPVDGTLTQKEDRYSIAYFRRPESNVEFTEAEGRQVTAEKWHDEKYVMFGEPHAKQDASMMLTGGMEPILL